MTSGSPREPADNPLAEATAFGLLDRAARAHGNRLAMIAGDERVTFAELRARALRLAAGLGALGLGPGDRVGIWLPTRPTWYVTQLAAAALGAVVVALNPRYRAHELGGILAQSGARALVLTDHLGPIDYLEILAGVLPGLAAAVPGEPSSSAHPALAHVIVDADDVYPGCHRLTDVLAAGDEGGRDAGRPDDALALLYTSGTTSAPKGAIISHRNTVPHAWNCAEVLALGPSDRVLHALPAAGTWGGLAIPLSAWSAGAALVLMDAWDAGTALRLIERERCTVWNAVDMMARDVLAHPALARSDRSSLRSGGFAATGGGGHGLFDAVSDVIGVPQLYQPYGMTEVNALAMLHQLDEPRALRELPGTTPAPGLEVRVADVDSGEPLGPDREGELQFRGLRVTRGYFERPEETAAALTADGWFRSGDLGVRRADDHVVFLGRLREVLRISHTMVSPGEIENYLMAHPAVAQAFVVGVPDPRTNEAAVAFVIPGPGARPTEAELQAFCRGRIASFKIPRAVFVVDDVPRTPGPHGDKAQRAKLRELARKELGR